MLYVFFLALAVHLAPLVFFWFARDFPPNHEKLNLFSRGPTANQVFEDCILLSAQAQNSFFFVMLRVWNVSGKQLAQLHVEELKAGLQGSEDLLVVALKRLLGAQLGCSRFQLKLLGEDAKEIDDDAPLTGPSDFTLVRMDFQSSDPATNKAFVSACEEGRVTEVDFFLHFPRSPHVRDAQYQMGTHLAAKNGHLDVMRLLLEAGADKDAATQNGYTALHFAAEQGHLDVMRLLLEAGADKNAATQNGHTALHLAGLYGHLNAVQMLLVADKNAATQNGYTALHYAAGGGHLDVVRLLLEAGADREKASADGTTALHFAVYNRHCEVVRLLLESGANKDAAAKDGTTALHLAAEDGSLDVVRLLLQAGADKNAAKEDGATALRIATRFDHLHVCELLQQAGAEGAAGCWPKRARVGN